MGHTFSWKCLIVHFWSAARDSIWYLFLASLCSGVSASKRCLIHSNLASLCSGVSTSRRYCWRVLICSNLASLSSHDSFANVTFLFSKRIFLSTSICDISLALSLAFLFPSLIFLFPFPFSVSLLHSHLLCQAEPSFLQHFLSVSSVI